MLDRTKPLWQAGACDIADAVGQGTLTAEEAVGAAVDRMAAVNGHLNAVVDDLSEDALARAAAVDRALADGGAAGPLAGVPVTIKVNADQTGRATTHGVLAFKDNVASADAPIVEALQEAGAIVIGRTNTPEFSFRATTDNPLHGRTFNPWDDDISPGGSSGGASSAVMAGIGAVAHGNDIGGSLRFPAWCTGAATVKPGLGRVAAWNPSQPAERGMLSQVMSVQGAICREVADVRRAMQVMIRADARDPWHVAMPWEGPALAKKVALTKSGHGFDVDPAVSAALDHAAGALADAGYDVEEVEPPLLAECAAEAAKSLFGETIEMLGGDIERHGSETIQAIFAEYARQFGVYRGRDLLQGFANRSKYVRAWMQFLEDWPLVLTPFMPTMPFAWDRDTEGEAGVREVLGAAVYSYSMNYMGLPAGNVAAGFAGELPVNVQLVGPRFREDHILDACAVIEAATGRMCDRLWAKGS